MAISQDSVFLLTGADPGKKAFGTGFAVAHKEGQLYLLTCAHVLDQLDGRVNVGGQEAEIKARGSADGIDLALLHIPCEQTPPLLNRIIKGKADTTFHICGYGPFAGAKNNYVLRDIEGYLGKSIAFESSGSGDRVEAWDIHVEDDEFSRLQGGYSGSPLCDEEGRLIAVVSHKIGNQGQRGHAVALANLQSIYPDIEQLLPYFSAVDDHSMIRLIKKRLMHHLDDIEDVFMDLRKQLTQMEKQGIDEYGYELLDIIEELLEGNIDGETFSKLYQSYNSSRSNTGPDYKKFTDRLQKGRVVLCLGQDIDNTAPSTEQIIERLVGQQEFQGTLSELCEQREIAQDCGRPELVEKMCDLCSPDKITPTALYELLTRLENPLLIISTSYDDLLEQSLRNRRKFMVIYPNIRKNKCLLRYSDQRDISSCTPEEVSDKKPLENGYTVIYKLRGGFIDDEQETLLLSERDYFSFTEFMQKKQFPDYISNKLNNHALWFIGHQLQSWEERLLVKSLQNLRDSRASALAIQRGLSDFCRDFWKDNRIDDFDLSLKDFVQGLEKEVAI